MDTDFGISDEQLVDGWGYSCDKCFNIFDHKHIKCIDKYQGFYCEKCVTSKLNKF